MRKLAVGEDAAALDDVPVGGATDGDLAALPRIEWWSSLAPLAERGQPELSHGERLLLAFDQPERRSSLEDVARGSQREEEARSLSSVQERPGLREVFRAEAFREWGVYRAKKFHRFAFSITCPGQARQAHRGSEG